MRALRVICLTIFATVTAAAQEPKRRNEFHVGCSGWTVLAFSGQESKEKELEPLGVDGVEVRVLSHELAEEQIVYLEPCGIKAKGKPAVEDYPYGRLASVVRGYRSYEVKGRIFAYGFTAYAVIVNDGFILERAGAAGNIIYIDKDGDGTFERGESSTPLRFLPDWVKAIAGKP